MVSNKEIQTERLLRYFLDSAKNIIKSEGIEALTVRSIADNAGYSFGTLYNYYKDVKELVFESGIEFMNECREYVYNSEFKSDIPEDIIKFKAGKYVEYFVQYTGIYHLLFLTGRTNIGKFTEFNDALIKMNNDIFKEDFEKLFGKSYKIMLDMYIMFINGSLLMYINRSYPADFLEFRKSFVEQTTKLLNLEINK